MIAESIVIRAIVHFVPQIPWLSRVRPWYLEHFSTTTSIALWGNTGEKTTLQKINEDINKVFGGKSQKILNKDKIDLWLVQRITKKALDKGNERAAIPNGVLENVLYLLYKYAADVEGLRSISETAFGLMSEARQCKESARRNFGFKAVDFDF